MDFQRTVREIVYSALRHALISHVACSSMGVSLTQHALLVSGYEDHVDEAYMSYASAWLLLLPLVTETVLFGTFSLPTMVAVKGERHRGLTTSHRFCLVPIRSHGVHILLVCA